MVQEHVVFEYITPYIMRCLRISHCVGGFRFTVVDLHDLYWTAGGKCLVGVKVWIAVNKSSAAVVGVKHEDENSASEGDVTVVKSVPWILVLLLKILVPKMMRDDGGSWTASLVYVNSYSNNTLLTEQQKQPVSHSFASYLLHNRIL